MTESMTVSKRTLPDTYRTSYPIREALQRFRKDGIPVNEIARRLGVDRSTVYYHLRIMGMTHQRPVVKGGQKKGCPQKPPEVNLMAIQWLRRRWK